MAASPTVADLALLVEAIQRVVQLNREVAALRQEIEGYRIVLHQTVTQLREITLRQRSGGIA